MRELDLWCSTFLYTNIDTEGLLQGFPLHIIPELKSATKRKIIAAGGVSSMDEVEKLDALGVAAIVGMAM
jgi:phosphoribosylformimino-5-aminoimidazole carboxamide ribonucleotide (ProFAR) isomerase